jgi:hypothetical protein
MTSTSSTITHTAAKASFTHVMDNVIQDTNVTKALTDNGIDNILTLLILTNDIVDNLTYHDPNPNVQKVHKLKMGELVSLNPSFTLFIFVKRQTPLVMTGNPLPWIILTNSGPTLHIPKDFPSLSSLPPLDMMYVDDSPNVHDVPDVHNVTDVHDVTNILDVTNFQGVTNVSDVSYDLSTTSDISKVTTTGEVLMVHHYVNTEYDANGPV